MNSFPKTIVKALLLFLLFLVLIIRIDHLYLNLSASEPRGIYQLMPSDSNLPDCYLFRGELIIMKVPVQARPYVYGRYRLPDGGLLLKNIGALPGDLVSITNGRIMINQQYYGPVYSKDSQGRPLPEFRGSFRIRPGYFLPLATAVPNSFDGRYFGPVSLRLIVGEAVPVLLFKKFKEGRL